MSADTHAAFDALYAAHRQTLHAYVLGRCGDADLALDLLQEVFVRAWRNLAVLRDLSVERQRAWLVAVGRNLVIDHARAAATRRGTSEALALQIGREAFAVAADHELIQRERFSQVDAAIKRLPEELRIVLVLQVVGERTSSEIGELLGRPAGTVRYQLAEARRRLARDLAIDR